MSGRKDGREFSSRHRSCLAVWGAYVTILGTVISLIFAWCQLRVAREGEERARRTEPLAYTLEAIETHYEYEIRQREQVVTIPAPSLRLQVTHGSLHAVTVISFDGSAFYEISELPFQDSWKDCVVDITVPPHAAAEEGGVVYDYFFLYLEPSEGRRQLDLICTTIALDTREIQSCVFHPVALAQTGFLPDGPRGEMLSAYDALYERLRELDLFAA